MTKEEKLQGNRLIAEFFGKSFNGSHINDYKGVSDESLPTLKYHSNYAWLMKAWIIFRDLKFTGMESLFMHSHAKSLISRAICYEEIEVAFIELCTAINWYSSIK